MKPVLNVHKRSHSQLRVLETYLYLICQSRETDEIIRDATSKGIASLNDASLTRVKFRCDEYVELTKTLNNNMNVLNDDLVRHNYHKTCYSLFCSTSHLDRLSKKKINK